jgi:hypothetical protein
MTPSEIRPYLTQIEGLRLELEAMRQRAEAAEHALRGVEWETHVRPLSLYQTRVLRILAQRDASADAITEALQADYPDTSTNCLKAQISKMRKFMPREIVPPNAYNSGWGSSAVYTIPDRPALAEFLRSGVLPEQRRAA